MNADEQLERWELEAAAARKERRERIATAALRGLLGTSSLAGASTYAAAAVKAADALIAELDKQP